MSAETLRRAAALMRERAKVAKSPFDCRNPMHAERTAENDAPEVAVEALRIGDRVRFRPGGHGSRWWTIRARDERFIVATMQAPFRPKGELWYTVVDLVGWENKRYNGAGNGMVRSSLNTLGGGWDLGPNGEGCEKIIPALRSGRWELSHRRVVSVWSIERAERTET